MISMHCSTATHPCHTWFFSSFIFCFLISGSFSDPRISESGLHCGSSPTTTKSPSLVPTFVKEMESLSQLMTNRHFATYHLNSSKLLLPMYALAQCHHDLSQTDCLLCYAASRTKLPRCLPSVSARIFLDGCFLRYDNYSFYNESVSSLDTVKCSNENISTNEKLEFVKGVSLAVDNVRRKALKNNGFGVYGVGRVYALAQCWESVGREGCQECLKKAGKAVRGCLPKKEGRGMNAGCYLRYSTEKFYNDGGDTGHGHGKFIWFCEGLRNELDFGIGL